MSKKEVGLGTNKVESAHSPMGASSFERVMNCPYSFVKSKGIPPRKPGQAAIKGTMLHDLAEKAILNPNMPIDKLDYRIKGYVKFCRDKINRGFKHGVEGKVRFQRFPRMGRGSADFWYMDGDMLHVVDLKTGSGISVDPVNNVQCVYYAAAIMDTFNLQPKKFRVTIYQVACEPIPKFWDFTMKEIANFRRVFASTIHYCHFLFKNPDVDPPYKPGKWSIFCPLGDKCCKFFV